MRGRGRGGGCPRRVPHPPRVEGWGGAHPEERTNGGAASAAPEERHEAEADMKETGAVRLPVAESQPATPPEVSDGMENGEGGAAGACAAGATMYTELLAAVASVEPSTEGRPMSTTARSWHARAFTFSTGRGWVVGMHVGGGAGGAKSPAKPARR